MTGGLGRPLPPARAARLLHASLLITPIGFLALALLLIPAGGPDLDPPTGLRWVALGIGATLVAVAAILRGTLPPRRTADPEDAWWQANLPRVFMLWSLAEAVGLAGGGLGVVAGDIASAAPLVVASTLLLLHLAPGRIARA